LDSRGEGVEEGLGEARGEVVGTGEGEGEGEGEVVDHCELVVDVLLEVSSCSSGTFTFVEVDEVLARDCVGVVRVVDDAGGFAADVVGGLYEGGL
jgi:hypothetical protein